MNGTRHFTFRTLFHPEESFAGIYSEPPVSFAERYPDVPKPEPPLSLSLLAAEWADGGLYGEDMPRIAADLLERGYDTPALRRLAGETSVSSSADVQDVVARVFQELEIPYPLSKNQARLIETRQVARQVIAGVRNAWAAASYLEIAIWGWTGLTPDLQELFSIHDEINWDEGYGRTKSVLLEGLIETFVRLANISDQEIAGH